MAGRGAPPKPISQRRNPSEKPVHEWEPSLSEGWQHGPIPEAPDGLLKVSRDAWVLWMESWIAAHWSPTDLPGLEVLITIYDQVRRGEFQRANELRLQMDTFGLTPKGQQDRRWAKPAGESTVAQVRQVKPRKLSAV